MASKVPEVSSLVQEAQEVFQEAYGGAAEVAAVAPGRVNIIGEHTDYNDGFVFPMVSWNPSTLDYVHHRCSLFQLVLVSGKKLLKTDHNHKNQCAKVMNA